MLFETFEECDVIITSAVKANEQNLDRFENELMLTM
jgi:hypothetical protein